MEDVFSQAALSPRAQITEWANVTGKDIPIGTSVVGTFISWFLNPAKDTTLGDQIVVVLKRESDGAVVGVSLKDKSFQDKNTGETKYFMRERVEQCLPGDRIGIRYDADKDMGPGKNPAKIVNIYNAELEKRAMAGNVQKTESVSVDLQQPFVAERALDPLGNDVQSEPTAATDDLF